MSFLTAEQVSELAEGAGNYRTFIYFLAYTGVRVGEAAALRRSRCDLLRSRVQVRDSLSDVGGKLTFGPTKTHAVRQVSLPRFLREMLAEHLNLHVGDAPESLVFTSPELGPLRLPNFRRRVWQPALERVGAQGLRIHDLRHTCAALLIAPGAHPKAIQQHLGHSSISVTLDNYGHLFPDDMERLTEGLETAYQRSLAVSPRSETVVELPAIGTK